MRTRMTTTLWFVTTYNFDHGYFTSYRPSGLWRRPRASFCKQQRCCYCQLDTSSRRRFIQSLVCCYLVSLSSPTWLSAQQQQQQESLEYYRNNLQQTVTELQVSISLLENNRLQDFRLQLRSPPFSLLRKSCTKLYLKTTEKGSERRKQAESTYRLLLRDLEKADFVALQLERNMHKENQNKQVLVDSLESCIEQLKHFIQLMSESQT